MCDRAFWEKCFRESRYGRKRKKKNEKNGRSTAGENVFILYKRKNTVIFLLNNWKECVDTTWNSVNKLIET